MYPPHIPKIRMKLGTSSILLTVKAATTVKKNEIMKNFVFKL